METSNVPTQIAFTIACTGQPLAYRWSIPACRWIRMGWTEAKLLLATGQARQVSYPGSRALAPRQETEALPTG